MLGNVDAGPAVLYRAIRENLSSKEVWLEEDWSKEIREKEEAQNTQSLTDHSKDYEFYYDWEG